MTATDTVYGHDLHEFADAYIRAALWSTSDESGEEFLDENYDDDDLAPEAMAQVLADCRDFLNHRLGGRLIEVAERLEAEGRWSLPGGAECTVLEYAGHDFWLTRNGHGCGFWDGDWPKGIAEGLDNLSKEFGEVSLYVGDDGLIWS